MSSDSSNDDIEQQSLDDGDVGSDNKMYSLLFSRCDKDNSGWALIDDLVDFIRRNVSGREKNEDVYDSEENIPGAIYNLDLLKCMLDTHAVDGEINRVTYEYVIGKWVNELRSHSPSSDGSSDRKSSIDGKEDKEDIDRNSSRSSVSSLLQESFETSGGAGVYSNHDMDPVQMMNSMYELQLEAKRLRERNEHLLLQMESSEENMRQLQSEKNELLSKIRNQQQGLAQLDNVKEDNSELVQKFLEGEKHCMELKEKIENMQQELQDLQIEISDLQNQLTTTTNEREDLYSQTQALHNTLSQKEEQIRNLEEEKEQLEARLDDQHQETESLHNRLTTTSEAVEELRLENSSLQQQINEKQHQPVSSTPYRPMAPSLHEELANSDLANGISPMLKMNSSIDELMDSMMSSEQGEGADLFDKLASSRVKFEEKAKLMEAGLSELIDTPLTTLGGGEKSKIEGLTTSTEDFKAMIETSLRKVETKKKRDTKRNHKLSEELKRVKEENENLRNKLNDLERQREDEQHEGAEPGELVSSHQSTQTAYKGLNDESIEETVTLSSIATQTPASDAACQVDVQGQPLSYHTLPDEEIVTSTPGQSAADKPGSESSLGDDKGCVVTSKLDHNIEEGDEAIVTSTPGQSAADKPGFEKGTSKVDSNIEKGDVIVPERKTNSEVDKHDVSLEEGVVGTNKAPLTTDSANTSGSVVSSEERETDSAYSSMMPTKDISPGKESLGIQLLAPSMESRATTSIKESSAISNGSAPVNELVNESVDQVVLVDESANETPLSLKKGEEPVSVETTYVDEANTPSAVGVVVRKGDVTDELGVVQEKGVVPIKSVVLTKEVVLKEEVVSGDGQYRELQEEITRLKEQLKDKDQSVPSVGLSATYSHEEDDLSVPGRDLSLVEGTPVTHKDDGSSRLIVRQRKPPQLKIQFIPGESIVTDPSSPQSGCLTSLGQLLMGIIKTSVWISVFVLVVLVLLVLLVSFNSAIGRCGGRVCSHSPLHMLFGQNLQYTHSGDIPI